MASYRELRPERARPAKSGRCDSLSFPRPQHLADMAPSRAIASPVSAQLAGVRDGEALPGPAFRRETLGSAQRSAARVGRPVSNLCSGIGGRHV
jgi:hypothetical protein